MRVCGGRGGIAVCEGGERDAAEFVWEEVGRERGGHLGLGGEGGGGQNLAPNKSTSTLISRKRGRQTHRCGLTLSTGL